MGDRQQHLADLTIGVDSIASSRRRAGFEVLPRGSGWSACPAPSRAIVIGADGGVGVCEYGAGPLGSAQEQSIAQTLAGADFRKLRDSLAQGVLPGSHCGACIRLCSVGRTHHAPLVRDYGSLTTLDGPQSWTVRLPEVGSLVAGVKQALQAELAGVERLVLEGVGSLSVGTWIEAFAALRASSARPPIDLRVGRIGDPAAGAAAVAGLCIGAVEVDLSHGDLAELKSARRLARSLSVPLRATFVFTPAHWFDYLDVAHACSQEPVVPLELRMQARSAEVPLAALSVDDLSIVRDVFRSTWSRIEGKARPAALVHGTLERAAELFLALLQHRAAVAASSGSDVASSISLPPPEHPWLSTQESRVWWSRILLGQAQSAAVQRWVAALLTSPSAERVLRKQVGLRILCQRIASERRSEPLMALLRKVYADSKQRAALVEEDKAAAQNDSLRDFGGPWADRLGLGALVARKKPFGIGRPKSAAGAPDVTVLIPSYRHQDYVVEAIRSVLAQDYSAINVVVVDDQSPDATVEKARTVADPRVHVRVNDRNLGLGNSVLEALRQVTTPFVALLNSDDLFHPARIRKCRAALLANPEKQLVTTGLFLVDAAGGEIRADNVSPAFDGQLVTDWVQWYSRATPQEGLAGEDLFPRLLEGNFLATSTNLVARTSWLLEQAESLQSLKYCLDWQLFLQAALEGSLHHIHEPLAAYRLHAANTVWFREGRRWSYYLEVNRVAAASLSRLAQRVGPSDERGIGRVLESVSCHLARNRETDGYALFLNAALDSVRLDGLAQSSEAVQHGIQQMNQAAEDVRAAVDLAAVRRPQDEAQRHEWDRLFSELAGEEVRMERGSRAWIEGYCETIEQRLRECWSGRDQIEAEKTEAYRQIETLRTSIVSLEARCEKVEALEDERQQLLEQRMRLRRDAILVQADLEALRQELAALQRAFELERGDALRARDEAASARAENVALQLTMDGLRAENDVLRFKVEDLELRVAAALRESQTAHVQISSLQADAVRLREELELLRGVQAEAAAAHGQVSRLQIEVADLRDEVLRRQRQLVDVESRRVAIEEELTLTQKVLAKSRADHTRATERASVAEDANSALRATRDALLTDVTRLRDEVDTLRRSREHRLGNFVWNKLPLGYVSRRGKKWYRRMLDFKNRGLIWLSRLFRRSRKASGTAVVAACWQWPIYSHTFVYQEMLGFTHMGLDLKMFHWDLGDMGQLHKAFDYLKDHRVQIQPVWESHLRDKEHFERTRPGRLRAFLERVSTVTGRSVEELEKEPIVLQGCTFARMAELAGANYLHSYFFYDQSFMVMQAAWLLDIPRGVSCYADHMLDDYPWKLVPLQVELASVVVATSARIKRELSAKSGGVHDDKIIVKPNGVDGARFQAFDRPLRKKDEPFEVISISRVEPKKGLIHLVEAIAELKKRGHNVIAHVVGSKDLHSKGSAEYAEQFDRRIQELGIGDRIVQHGMMKQEDLAPILKKCRAFVAPYVELGSGDKDGIPTAMLEGLASGLPVVTTDSGSILEVVDNGVEGIVVAQRDSKAFAEALLRLVADPELERRMAKAARARFDKEFDIRVTEKRLHERVAALVAKAKARR